jgi:hypothetical protein
MFFWMKDGNNISANVNHDITVYPRTHIAQIITNETYINLAIAAYFAGVVSAINIIWQLWNERP